MATRQGWIDTCSFPQRHREFLGAVTRVLDAKVGRGSYSIFLFGSMAKRDFPRGGKGTNDIDLLVILDDATSKDAESEAFSIISALDRRLTFPGSREHLVNKILHVVERQTGMHVNAFHARASDLAACKFWKIFGTNKVSSRFLAPALIVLESALHGTVPIHPSTSTAQHRELLLAVKERLASRRIPATELLKSLLMNLVLSISSLVIFPITRRATRYSIEAVKWSMHATSFASCRKTLAKPVQARLFVKMGIGKKFLDRWMQRSKVYATDASLALRSPFQVIKIHAKGLARLGKTG